MTTNAVPPVLDEELVLLRVADVVRHTGLSKTVVYAMIAAREIPSLRRGRSVRVPLLALRRWIKEKTIDATPL
jgi:excisionase family DNA binding protein